MTDKEQELHKILDEYFADRTNASKVGDGTGTRTHAHRKAVRRIKALITKHTAAVAAEAYYKGQVAAKLNDLVPTDPGTKITTAYPPDTAEKGKTT